MNKKIKDAAKDHVYNLAPPVNVCFMDTEEAVNWQAERSFKTGAEWALREAIEICNKKLEQNFQYIKSKGDYVDPKTFNLIQEVRRVSMALQFIVKEIEQLLSSEDKNEQKD